MKRVSTLLGLLLSIFTYAQNGELTNPSYVPEPDLTRTIDISKPVFSIPASVGASGGAANYTVPISVPSGINGMTPQVAISYNSNGGHSDLGYAWSLSAASEISVVGKNYALDDRKNGLDFEYYDKNEYSLDGQRLIHTSGLWNVEGSEYITSVESYQQIIIPDGSPNSFLVANKAGLKRYYGVSASHRVEVNNPAFGIPLTYKWLLEYAEDINGNRIEYDYDIDPTLHSYRITKISYIKVGAAVPLAEIIFNYTKRTDNKSGFIDGFLFGHNHLLESIESTYNNQRFSKYTFKYTFRTGITGNDISRLVEIDYEALNGTKVNSTLIDWHDASVEQFFDLSLKPTYQVFHTSSFLPITSLNAPQTQIVDINGDGFDDILTLEYNIEDLGNCWTGLIPHTMTEHKYTLYANIKDQSPDGFSRVRILGPIKSQSKPGNCNREGFAKFYTGDFNGDGLIDFLIHRAEVHELPNSPNWYHNFPIDFYINDATTPGTFTKNKTIDQDNHLYFGYTENSAKPEFPNFYPYDLTIADFDGDGISDISYIGSQHDATTPSGTTSYVRYLTHCHIIFVNKDLTIQREMYNEEISFGSSGVQMPNVGDFNGDGKADLMFVDDLKSTIITNTSNRTQWKVLSSGGFPTSFHYIQVGDFNGDGLSDVLTQVPNATNNFEVHYFNGQGFDFPSISPNINYNINFLNSSEVGGRPTYFITAPFVFTADFDKDGRTDVLVYEEKSSNGNTEYNVNLHFNKVTGWSHKKYVIPTNVLGNLGVFQNNYFHAFHLASFYGDESISLFVNILNSPQDQKHFNLKIRPDDKSTLVRQILDGYNRLTTFNYKRLTDPSVYTRAVKAYPNPTLMASIPVVSEIKQDDFEKTGSNGGAYISHNTYSYHNLKYNSKGLGMLGYVRERVKDKISLLESESVKGFISASLVTTNHLFLPVEQNTKLSSTSAVISKETISYQNTSLKETFANGNFVFNTPKILESKEFDYLKGTSSKTSLVVYDNDGNITSSKNEVFSNTSASGSALVTSLNTASYINAGSWLKNVPTQTQQLITRSGKPQVKTEETYSYYPIGSLQSKVSQPNTLYSVTETYNYTSEGSIGSIIVTPTGMTARTTAFTYSADKRFVLTETNPLNWVTTYTYNDLEQTLASEEDENSLTTTYAYDDLNRLTRKNFSDGINYEELNYTWDLGTTESGALYSEGISGSNMPTSQTWYNGKLQGFLAKAKNRDDQWVSNTTQYNDKNQVWKVSLPFIGSTASAFSEYAYDDYGRTILETLPTTITITTSYTNNSVMVEHSGTGESSTKVFDASGSNMSSTDAGGIITYDYDSWGNALSITTPSGTTTMEYDNQGYQTDLNDPAAGLMQYENNALGEITRQEDARGKVFTMTYDKLGRLLVKSGPDGNYTYTYDQFKGSLVSVTSPYNTSNAYGYDSKGRLVVEIENMDGQQYELHYTYDLTTGGLQKKIYPNNLEIFYSYDNNGYLTKIEDGDGGLVWEYGKVNALGQIREYTLGETTVSRIYDPVTGLPADYFNDKGWSYSYSFNNLSGNLDSRTNNQYQITEAFDYDPLNRLSNQESESGSTIGVTYAANGNILNKTDAGDYENEQNGRTSIVSNGSNISDDSQAITYTPFNSVATIMEGNYDASFIYGADEQRRQMIVQENGQPIIYRVYLFGSEYELDLKDEVLRNLVYVNTPTGQEAVFITEDGSDEHQLYLLNTDYLGSILAITDEVGTVLEEYSYDAWGNRREVDTWVNTYNPGDNYNYFNGIIYRGFTGHEHLDEFGLINMNGRVYDPLLGRMLSPDNFVQNSGYTQNYNRYTYAYGNPLKYTDPDGEIVWAPIIIGAVIGSYLGGSTANGTYNPMQWDYGSNRTWGFMLGGALVGGFSGGYGNLIATSGMPFANTASIVASSFINSVGTNVMTGGQTDVGIGFGFGSFNLSTGEFGYLGKNGNGVLQNVGYAFGTLGNLSDALMGFNANEVDLVTEHSGGGGHSALVKSGTKTPGGSYDSNSLVSVGPDYRAEGASDNWHWNKGKNTWNTYSNYPRNSQAHPNWRQSVMVNTTRINNYSKWLNRRAALNKLNYSVEISSCVTHTSRALNSSGVFNIGIHPYFLNAQMNLRNLGVRPVLFSHNALSY